MHHGKAVKNHMAIFATTDAGEMSAAAINEK
jgi:hypothetical protein